MHVPTRTILALVAKQSWLPYDLVIIKRDAPKALVTYLLERDQSFPGVEVQQSYLRAYPLGDLAAPILGYLGQIDPQQLKRPGFKGYLPDDEVGQSGVEATYDRWLQGKDGASKVEVNALGKPVAQAAGGSLPEPGDNLVLTIDARIQKAAEKAIRFGIALAHVAGFPQARAGAAVVLDAHSGAVLAMASYPTYNPTWFSGGISAKHMARCLRPQADDPLVERAIAGEYPTGSTFKVVDTIAGLQTGVLSPSTTLYAGATYSNHGATVARLEPERPRHDRPDPGHRAVGRHLLLSGRLRLLPAPRQRARRLGADAGLRSPDRHRHPGRGRPASCRRRPGCAGPTPRRPIPPAGGSTASGSRATRSTWRSARATCWPRPCRWRSTTRPSPTAATS